MQKDKYFLKDYLREHKWFSAEDVFLPLLSKAENSHKQEMDSICQKDTRKDVS